MASGWGTRAAAGGSGGGWGTGAAAGGSGGGSRSTDSPPHLIELFARQPVAFLGGILAGALALDAGRDPLKQWVDATAGAAGLRYSAAVRLAEQQQQRSAP